MAASRLRWERCGVGDWLALVRERGGGYAIYIARANGNLEVTGTNWVVKYGTGTAAEAMRMAERIEAACHPPQEAP